MLSTLRLSNASGVWLVPAAVVGMGLAAGSAPAVALGIGLAAGLSLSGSI